MLSRVVTRLNSDSVFPCFWVSILVLNNRRTLERVTGDFCKRVVFGDLLLHLLCELLFQFLYQDGTYSTKTEKWVCTGRDRPGQKKRENYDVVYYEFI